MIITLRGLVTYPVEVHTKYMGITNYFTTSHWYNHSQIVDLTIISFAQRVSITKTDQVYTAESDNTVHTSVTVIVRNLLCRYF